MLGDFDAGTEADKNHESLFDDNTEISSLADESIQRIELPPEQQQPPIAEQQQQQNVVVESAISPPQEIVIPIKLTKKEGYSLSTSNDHSGRRLDRGECYPAAVNHRPVQQQVTDVQFSSPVSVRDVTKIPTVSSPKPLPNRLSAFNLYSPATVGFISTPDLCGTLSPHRVSFASGFDDLHVPVDYEVTASDLSAENLLGGRPRHNHRRIRSATSISIVSMIGQSVVTATTTEISPSADSFILDLDYIGQEETAVKAKRRMSKLSQKHRICYDEDEEEEFRSTARSLQRKHSRGGFKQMVGKVSTPIRRFKRGAEESAELNRSKGCLV